MIQRNPYTAWGEQVSPVRTPANPSGVGTGGTQPINNGVNGRDYMNFFASPVGQAFAQYMSAQSKILPQQQQTEQGAIFGRHLGIGGQEITPDNPRGNVDNPFGGPLQFQSAGDRLNEMTNHTGAYARTPSSSYAVTARRPNRFSIL